MMTDPIADMLTRIRNASAVHKERVTIPFSRMKSDILSILKQERYIADYTVEGEGARKNLLVTLRYVNREPSIVSLKRVSKPGCRIYAKSDAVRSVLNNQGIAILSTSRGIMTNGAARKAGVGGEVLCEIY